LKTYQETLNWMFSKLPMYQRVGEAAYRPGLEGMIGLDIHLGKPHQSFNSIHVAGTNGKGSTSHMIAAVLQNAGYKVGLYTSPHLLDFRERIKINGEKIPETEVIRFIEQHQIFFNKQKLSFFEMTVGMAFNYFHEVKVDFAIVEVGLGGRLDATNIIRPILSVITNIGLDHTDFLGPTRKHIAKEKAGIIKHKVPVVIGQKDTETQEVFEAIASANSAPLYYSKLLSSDWETDLKGKYQKENLQTAVMALNQLSLVSLNEEILKEGLKTVVSRTGFRGRWQVIREEPYTVLDVGHNKEGISELVNQLKTIDYNQLHIVLGFVKGKNVLELLSLFPDTAEYYLCAPKIARAISLESLRDELENSLMNIHYSDSVEKAYIKAVEAAESKDMILICGSTFVVAEVMEFLQDKNQLK